MKAIILFNSAEVAVVDDEDYERCMQYKWKLCSNGYVTPNTHNERGLLLHRFILKMDSSNKWNVDHINKNPLDNRKSNLRQVSQSENLLNASLRSDNKTGYRGVSFDKLHNKYRAQGKTLKGRSKYLGLFKDVREAAKAYNKFMETEWKDYPYQLNIV